MEGVNGARITSCSQEIGCNHGPWVLSCEGKEEKVRGKDKVKVTCVPGVIFSACPYYPGLRLGPPAW